MGMPIRAEEIAELTRPIYEPEIVATIPEESDKDDPLNKLLEQLQ
jgi:hypothetical protein